jgi:hypothetical protein
MTILREWRAEVRRPLKKERLIVLGIFRKTTATC